MIITIFAYSTIVYYFLTEHDMSQEQKQKQKQEQKQKPPMPPKLKEAMRKAALKAHEDWKNGVRR